ILLSVLSKNRAGTWFSSQRARNPLLSFFCPTDHSLGWEERGKSNSIDCLICHAQLDWIGATLQRRVHMRASGPPSTPGPRGRAVPGGRATLLNG
ncbi:MAG: hypothetical protein ACK55Z_30850, partial [bacterium]